jgi:hypothetical protein
MVVKVSVKLEVLVSVNVPAATVWPGAPVTEIAAGAVIKALLLIGVAVGDGVAARDGVGVVVLIGGVGVGALISSPLTQTPATSLKLGAKLALQCWRMLPLLMSTLVTNPVERSPVQKESRQGPG